jgi:tape measure domain-containing protein
LSQALGSGVLRGEEFNAIMENGGRLAKLLADGMKTTVAGCAIWRRTVNSPPIKLFPS